MFVCLTNNHPTTNRELKGWKIHSSSPSAFVQKMRQIDNCCDMLFLARSYSERIWELFKKDLNVKSVTMFDIKWQQKDQIGGDLPNIEISLINYQLSDK